jgi:K+-sensing histidine kinase KdpD
VWIDELPLVTVDEHAISEAIYTLIDNAAKYSPPSPDYRAGDATKMITPL